MKKKFLMLSGFMLCFYVQSASAYYTEYVCASAAKGTQNQQWFEHGRDKRTVINAVLDKCEQKVRSEGSTAECLHLCLDIKQPETVSELPLDVQKKLKAKWRKQARDSRTCPRGYYLDGSWCRPTPETEQRQYREFADYENSKRIASALEGIERALRR